MKNTQKILPKLRFPEFAENGEWVEKKLGDLINIKSGYSPSRYHLQNSGKYPFVKVEELNNCEKYQILSREYSNDTENIIPSISIIFPKRGAAIMLNKVRINNVEILMDTNMMALATRNKIDTEFLYYIILKIGLHKIADTSTIPQINNKHIEPFEIVIPVKKEQQKIAACLTSLDELIAAHNDKLETLKDHKKGLMQNLFPQGDETIPNYRFPEFEEDGEWVEKSIQDLIDENTIVGHLDGNHGALYPKTEEFSKVGIPYISANDFVSGLVDFSNCKHLPLQRAEKFKKGVAKNGDILFAHNATVGPVAKLVTDLPFIILSTTATYYRCDNEMLINDFLKFTLLNPFFVAQYTRVMSQSTRNQVPITTQRLFYIQLPNPKEQQKIASCLSALDELISAEAENIEQLQLHKKGLMQGLFPSG